MIVSQTHEQLGQIAGVVRLGGVIAFRTDTFYGLGADPFNASAVARIKHLKGREGDKPILVVISDIDQVDRFIAGQSRAFKDLMQRFWPGSLTIIGDAGMQVSDDLTGGTKTLAVRLPGDDEVRRLIRTCGGALTATSANPSGESPAHTAEEVHQYFDDEIDLIVDGGPAKTEQPSTVIDATTEEVRLIREGVIPWKQIQVALGKNQPNAGR